MRNPASRTLKAAVMLLALAACSTDSPTAPERTPAPPPGSGPSTAWNISVTVDPRDLTASDSQPATVTVRVRRADNGAPPQDGTTTIVSAGLGDFNSAASGERTATVSLSAGAAQLLYFAGEILGQDTIQARLENSVGSARINILEAKVLFIQSVAPNSGPQSGGTRIRISGTGFSEPARVELDSGASAINAVVDRVGDDSDGEFIRALTGPVFDPDTFFGTENCDTDGDGVEDGRRFLPKTVGVTVILTEGSVTLANAFTYRPRDTSCRDITPDPDRPNARFSFTVNGLTVLFNNESTPAGLSFNWLFGDGATSTSASPVHDYACPTLAQPGPTCTYDVTLRAVNSSGEDTTTKTVTVTSTGPAAPVANFSFFVAGKSVTFTNTSTPAGNSFTWVFGDGSPTSAVVSPVHLYTCNVASCSFDVTLFAVNASGTDTTTQTVTVAGP